MGKCVFFLSLSHLFPMGSGGISFLRENESSCECFRALPCALVQCSGTHRIMWEPANEWVSVWERERKRWLMKEVELLLHPILLATERKNVRFVPSPPSDVVPELLWRPVELKRACTFSYPRSPETFTEFFLSSYNIQFDCDYNVIPIFLASFSRLHTSSLIAPYQKDQEHSVRSIWSQLCQHHPWIDYSSSLFWVDYLLFGRKRPTQREKRDSCRIVKCVGLWNWNRIGNELTLPKIHNKGEKE